MKNLMTSGQNIMTKKFSANQPKAKSGLMAPQYNINAVLISKQLATVYFFASKLEKEYICK